METESDTLTGDEEKKKKGRPQTSKTKQQKEPKEPKPVERKMTVSQMLTLQKRLIIQIPDTVSDEDIEYIRENMQKCVELLNMDTAEIRTVQAKTGIIKQVKNRDMMTAEDQKEHYRVYNSQYYHSHLKKDKYCPHCDQHFTASTSVNRHLKHCKKCKAIRKQKEELEKESPQEETHTNIQTA
jgi:hypothetical protein